MLNCAAAPTNDLRIRQALAKATERRRRCRRSSAAAVQAGQRALPAGLAVLQQDRLPHLRPDRGQGPGQPVQGQARTPRPPAHDHPRPHRHQGGPGPPADVATRLGFDVSLNERRAGHHHQRLHRWASSRRSPPTSSGRSDPDLNYVWWSTTTISPLGSIGLNFARTQRSRHSRRPCSGAATPPTRPPGSAAYQTVNEQPGRPAPLPVDRAVLLLRGGGDRVQNFNNPTLPDGKPRVRLQRGHLLPRPRSG